MVRCRSLLNSPSRAIFPRTLLRALRSPVCTEGLRPLICSMSISVPYRSTKTSSPFSEVASIGRHSCASAMAFTSWRSWFFSSLTAANWALKSAMMDCITSEVNSAPTPISPVDIFKTPTGGGGGRRSCEGISDPGR